MPLRVYSESALQVRSRGRTFLGGATCLGDILHANGYRSVFLGGADLSFSGKGTFLADHGYDSAFGRPEWERSGERKGAFNEWGLFDGPLVRRARDELTWDASARAHLELYGEIA